MNTAITATHQENQVVYIDGQQWRCSPASENIHLMMLTPVV